MAMAKAKLQTIEVTQEEAAAAAFRRQIQFWIAAVVGLAVFVYLFSSILLPFVAGMVLAYFLDPVADRLQRLGFSRIMATIVILIAFLIVLVLGLVVLIPILASQLTDFIAKLPEYLTELQGLITSYDPKWIEQRFGVDANSLREGLNSLVTTGFSFLSTVFKSIWSSGVALFSSPACLSSRLWLRSTCCSTGTAWSPPSTVGCRATMSKPFASWPAR